MNRKERRRQAKLNRTQADSSFETYTVTEDTPCKTDEELIEIIFRNMSIREIQSWDEDNSEHLEQAVFNRVRDFAYGLLEYKADTLTKEEEQEASDILDKYIEKMNTPVH